MRLLLLSIVLLVQFFQTASSQLQLGIENTARIVHPLPFINNYPMKFETIPSITIFNSSEKCDFGIKLGVLYGDRFFEQGYSYSWGSSGSGGSQSSKQSTVYKSRLRYSYFSESTHLRCKLGKKRQLYLNFSLGFEAKMTETESDFSETYTSSWGSVIYIGPNAGTTSGSSTSINYDEFNGVDCQSNIIKGNMGIGYFFNLTPHIKINSDLSFGFVTNQILYFKSSELKHMYPYNGIYGTLFLSTGINYTFDKKKKNESPTQKNAN